MNHYQDAIAALKKVKSVYEWNEIRHQFAPLLNYEQVTYIDTSGLIVKVLGKDIRRY